MKKTIIINSETFGTGSDELGQKLMGSFLRKLWLLDDKPDKIVFYNSGVKLLAEGSSVLDALSALADAGIDLIACGTCAAYYNLNDRIIIGRISNMEEIASTLTNADTVITV